MWDVRCGVGAGTRNCRTRAQKAGHLVFAGTLHLNRHLLACLTQQRQGLCLIGQNHTLVRSLVTPATAAPGCDQVQKSVNASVDYAGDTSFVAVALYLALSFV